MSHEKLEISADNIGRGLPVSGMPSFTGFPEGSPDLEALHSCTGCGVVVLGRYAGKHAQWHALILNLIDGMHQIVERTGTEMTTRGSVEIDFERIQL